MKKIAQITEDIITTDEIALEALRQKVLNLSAYSKKIKPLIEKQLIKKIKIGSVVTALSRMTDTLNNITPLRANVRIEDMGIKSPLCEITFEKTKQVAEQSADFSMRYFRRGFFTSTQSTSEITLIVFNDLKDKVLESIGVTPKGVYENLAAITVRFIEEEYIDVPNMLYTLMAVLASRRINIIEIVSTFTEIIFIVRLKDLKETVDVLNDNFSN